jgi:RimJ/RimL family protein N-acetyltransferase
MDLQEVALTSERLSLRSLKPDDAAEIFASITAALTRFMTWSPAPTLGAFEATWRDWLARMAAGTDLSLVIRLAASGEFLGMASLHGIGSDDPEPGIWIKETAQGLGYGREAVAALIGWAAHELGIDSFIYPVMAANARSCRLAERLGGTIVVRHFKSAQVEEPLVVYRIQAPAAR